jgi:D-sedoheptulose 7-phosphate isomerase
MALNRPGMACIAFMGGTAFRRRRKERRLRQSATLHWAKDDIFLEIIMNQQASSDANDFVVRHLAQAREILDRIDTRAVVRLVELIASVRAGGGRLFLLGVGGSAANCSHAVNDFRKLCGIEAYAPTDNVSELTARINDEGWAGVFAAWLQASRLNRRDMVFIMSVGGGDVAKNVSPNLVEAIKLAKAVGAKVGGIVGRDGGYTAQVADACVIVPTVAPDAITPHTEAFQAVIWHLLVSHPLLKTMATKWESVACGDSPPASPAFGGQAGDTEARRV